MHYGDKTHCVYLLHLNNILLLPNEIAHNKIALFDSQHNLPCNSMTFGDNQHLDGTQWHLSYRAHSFGLAARTSCKPLIKLRRSLRSASGWRLHVEMWNILSIITSKTTKLLHWMWKIRTGKQVQSQAFSITLKSVHCLCRNDSSHLLLSQWEVLKLKWKANCSCSICCYSNGPSSLVSESLAIGWTVSRDKSCWAW